MKKIVITLFKVFIVFFVTGLLLEIGLRIFPRVIPLQLLHGFAPELRTKIAQGRFQTRDSIVILNRDDGGPQLWIMKPFTKIIRNFDDPGFVKTTVTDEIGFCNLPGIYRGTSTIDIITIGDSFTWSHGVNYEDTWTKQLSDLTGLSAYNLGKGHAGLYEYLQIFKKFGIQKSPRFVIMNVYGGNDLRDAIKYHSSRKHQKSEGVSAFFNPHGSYQVFKKSLLGRHSYFVNLVFVSVSYASANLIFPQPEQNIEFRYQVVFTENSVSYNSQNTDKREVFNAKRLLGQEIDLGVFTEALKSFIKLSQDYNFLPIVTYTPSAHIAYAARVVFTDPDLDDIMPRFSNEQRNFFSSKAKELGYIFIDFTPALQVAAAANDSQKLLYYPTTLHLTSHGHKVIADVLRSSPHLRD